MRDHAIILSMPKKHNPHIMTVLPIHGLLFTEHAIFIDLHQLPCLVCATSNRLLSVAVYALVCATWQRCCICFVSLPIPSLLIHMHVNPERSFRGTNGESPSEASQLRKGGSGGPPGNFQKPICKWCNLSYS